jgi:hypothetical protein
MYSLLTFWEPICSYAGRPLIQQLMFSSMHPSLGVARNCTIGASPRLKRPAGAGGGYALRFRKCSCYGGESDHTGSGRSASQPVLVVAGLLVNTHRAGKTRREFRDLLSRISSLAAVQLRELKGLALSVGVVRGDTATHRCGDSRAWEAVSP